MEGFYSWTTVSRYPLSRISPFRTLMTLNLRLLLLRKIRLLLVEYDVLSIRLDLY